MEKLKEFVPGRIFDAHAHLYDVAYLPEMATPGSIYAEYGPVADRAGYERHQGALYAGIEKLRLNVVSVPDGSMSDRPNGHRARCNEFLASHLESNPCDVGAAIVLPDDTDEDIKNLLVHPNIRGLKCYHVMAGRKPTWQADIDEYLPESAWRVADEYGLCVTLHMVKDAALADPANNRIIREKAKKYPNAKLILAHAARGFAAWTVLEGVKGLSEFPNVYFDVSAICEPMPICAVLKESGPEKVLWGSDFPVSMIRGKCISIGAGFLWLETPLLEKQNSLTPENVVFVGMENLSALKQACEILDLGRADVEDIFYNNAMRLFGLSD